MKIDQEELNIYDAEALSKELIVQLQEEDILIDMSQARKIDMSIIQLFISAQKSCAQNNKLFTLKNTSDEVRKILSECACDFLLGVPDE